MPIYGLEMMVIAAARAAAEGRSHDEVVALVEKMARGPATLGVAICAETP